MGEVYLAEDTKLDRKVALKILPAEVASKQERMERFIREAKAAAALNHPNIAHVYEIDEVDGHHFIAMEFVDGQTLRDKIHKDHSDLRKLLRYLQQVAEGLSKAHAAGIVHRDLKPDNVMIARDGYAKILDFGLAKLVEPQITRHGDEAFSEVATAVMPQHSLPGTVMGTAGYMSPEQAQGKVNEVDHRSDIFAFGCMLYEAATGHKAFKGKDALDSLHNIVHAPTPHIKDLNPIAPDELQRILRRCLAKDPEKRYQSIKDVAIEIDELRQELKGASDLHESLHHTASGIGDTVSSHSDSRQTFSQTAALTSQAQSTPPTSSSKIILNELTKNKKTVVLVLVVIAILAGAGWYAGHKLRNAPSSTNAGKMKITRLVTGVGRLGNVSVSPDGKYVAYAIYSEQTASLWLRQVSQDASLQIVPPVEDAWFTGTCFSPDGELIYFVGGNNKTNTQGSLYQVPVLGARDPKKIVDHATGALTLSPDGRQIAFLRYTDKNDESSLMVTKTDGSEQPRKLAARQTTGWFTTFAWSPDGKRIAMAQASVPGGLAYSLVEIPADGGAEKPMSEHKWKGEVGGIHWLRDDTGIILQAAEKVGDARQYYYLSFSTGEVRRITNDLNEYGSFGVTADGATIVSNLGEGSTKIWIAGAGEDESKARRISNGKHDGRGGSAWTADGRIVFATRAGEYQNLWIMNSDGSNVKPLTSHPYLDSQPLVSPDGSYVVFQSSRPDNTPHIWRVNIDGSNLKQLTFTEDNAPSFSADGQWVLFHSWRSGSPNLWKVPANGGEQVQISSLRLNNGSFSSDGKQILCGYYDENATPPRVRPAIVSAETGQVIRLIDSPPTAGQFRWSRDGSEFIYMDTIKDVQNIWGQALAGGPAKQLTRFTSDFISSFDLSRDGKRLVVSRTTYSNEIVLIRDFK